MIPSRRKTDVMLAYSKLKELLAYVIFAKKWRQDPK